MTILRNLRFLNRYIKEYVTCHTCRSPETVLQKDTRLFFLQCDSCGSRCSVASIKSGFQVITNSLRMIYYKIGQILTMFFCFTGRHKQTCCDPSKNCINSILYFVYCVCMPGKEHWEILSQIDLYTQQQNPYLVLGFFFSLIRFS